MRSSHPNVSSKELPQGHATRSRASRFFRRAGMLGAILVAGSLGGCLERTVTITSDPPGALVVLNDVEVGRTPVTTGFTYYGDFDVRLRKEGYEPLVTHHSASAPIYEYPPFDLGATAWPGRITTDRHWHFVLTPSPDPKADEPGLVERARELQSKVNAQ